MDALSELKSIPHWVAWRYEDRGGPKPTKPPINPHTGEKAKSNDRRTWGTFAQAEARARQDELAGVGFNLSEDDDFTGYDLDKCRNPQTGKVKPWAQEILNLRETYAEVSPSGTGIRLIARGKIAAAVKFDPACVEMYATGRYLTITGQHIEGMPTTINEAARTRLACQERAKLHGEAWSALKKAGKNLEFKERKLVRKSTTASPPKPGGIIDRAGDATNNVTSLFPNKDKDPFWSNLNTAALGNLAAWVPALFPQAKPASTGAYRVTSRDLGRDLQEDLSIHPQGITDWGIDDIGSLAVGQRRPGGYTPISIVMEYGHQGSAESAALWLCKCLNIAPASLGWRGGVQETPSRIFYFDDCEKVVAKPWILKGLIARGECSSWIAPPAKGKSGLLVAISVFAAAGKDFFRFRSKGACGVLYLAFERASHTRRRLTRYRQKGFKGLPIAVRPGVINLMDPAGVEIIVASIKEAEGRLGIKIGLVIVDTFAKGLAIGGGDENLAKDQGMALAHLQRVRDETGVHTAIIHHTGKDVKKGARGSNAQVADVDIEVTITGEATRVAKVTKANDQPEGELVSFTIESETIGVDEDGDEITVGILADERVVGRSKNREWPGRLERLRESINDALVDAGLDHHISRGPIVRATHLDHVRGIYRQKIISVNPDASRPHKKADDALGHDIERASHLNLIGTANAGQARLIWLV